MVYMPLNPESEFLTVYVHLTLTHPLIERVNAFTGFFQRKKYDCIFNCNTCFGSEIKWSSAWG